MFQEGLIFYYSSNYKTSLRLFFKSLGYFSSHKDKQQIADIYQNLGMVYNETNDTTKAIHYYLKSLNLNEELKNEKRIASVSHNIGVLYSSVNKPDIALSYYKEALTNFKNIGFEEGEATAINNIGDIFEKKGCYIDALKAYKNALKIFERLNQIRSVIIVNYNIGRSYRYLGEYELAKKFLIKSANLAEQMSLPAHKADAFLVLSEIYELQGNYKQSLEYYKEFNYIDDSIYSLASQTKITEIESRFNNELTIKELALKTKKLNKKTQILYVFIVGAFLFLVVIILLYVENRQKVKAQHELLKHQMHLERLVKKKTEALEFEITERKIAEESDKLKSAFLANMSHEIRTPMNSIIAFSNFLKDRELSSDKQEEYINYIISCGKNLLQLINDILDIAKIEASQLKISKETCNVTELLQETFQIFKESKSKYLNKIDFKLKKHLLHENITVVSDYNRLKQVFTNLLENSFKYTKEGVIEFGIEKIKYNLLFFYVKDSGIGIPTDKSKVIFERFRQVETSIDKKTGGAGLGLAICNNLIKLLGGKIWVDSKPGTGAVFYFTIPYLLPEGKNLKKFQVKTDEINKTYNWENKNILVAEDEDLNFKVIEIAIKKTGANIFRVKNGKEAIEFCMANNIDIVLMDIQMPVMDGYTATSKIKEFKPDLPIIAQTSFAMNEDKIKCFKAGCNDFITKPLNITLLYGKIDQHLNPKQKTHHKELVHRKGKIKSNN